MVYAHDNDRPTVWLEVVSNDYFRLISAAPVAGRLFDTREQVPQAAISAVVNESLARKFWPGQDPLGRRFRTSQTKDGWVTVVGVVPDLQMQGIFAAPNLNEAGFYLAQDQMGWGWLDLFIRTKGDPLSLVTPVRQAIAGIDPNQPIHSIGTLTSQTAQAMRGFSMVGMMALAFAAISLFLGALGVYGVTSQAVSQRTREFGIRMALGSTVGQLLNLVLRQGGRHIGIGLGIGLGGGFLLTLPMAQIFGGSVANKPAIYLIVTVTNNTAAPVALSEGWQLLQDSPDPFDLPDFEGCPRVPILAPGQSCTRRVRFWSVAGAGSASPAVMTEGDQVVQQPPWAGVVSGGERVVPRGSDSRTEASRRRSGRGL